MALSYAGNLSFNPLTDSLKDASGREFKFDPPTGDELPSEGYAAGRGVLPSSAFV